jgi:integral membrane protein
MAHGLLFLLYLAAAVQAAFEYKWTWRRTLLIAAASLVPFGPFYVDVKYLRDQSAPR